MISGWCPTPLIPTSPLPRSNSPGSPHSITPLPLGGRLHGREALRSRGVFEFLERAWRWRDAVLAGELAHPVEVAMTLFDGQVQIDPRQFLAEGADVEV